MFVERDIETQIVKVVEEALADRHLHAEAQNVAIYGETGVGKSEIVKRILAAHPERRDPETGCIVRPVLYTDVRNSSTPKAAAQAMLVQLATFNGELMEDTEKLLTSTAAMSGPDITRRVKAQMMGQGVILSILDEFHNTVTDNGAVRLNRIADWVKDFAKSKSRSAAKPDGDLNETIVVVLVGTRKIKSIIEPTVNAELASIAPYRVEVNRYAYGSEKEKEAFHAFLRISTANCPSTNTVISTHLRWRRSCTSRPSACCASLASSSSRPPTSPSATIPTGSTSTISMPPSS